MNAAGSQRRRPKGKTATAKLQSEAGHNNGKVPHTKKFKPWTLETAIAFRSRMKASPFEHYLKSHAGRAFTKTLVPSLDYPKTGQFALECPKRMVDTYFLSTKWDRLAIHAVAF